MFTSDNHFVILFSLFSSMSDKAALAPITVVSSPQFGRYFVASRRISEGECVLVARPYAMAWTETQGIVCSGCFSEPAKGLKSDTKPFAAFLCPAGCDSRFCSESCFVISVAVGHHSPWECQMRKAFLETLYSSQRRLDPSELEMVMLVAAILSKAWQEEQHHNQTTEEKGESFPHVLTISAAVSQMQPCTEGAASGGPKEVLPACSFDLSKLLVPPRPELLRPIGSAGGIISSTFQRYATIPKPTFCDCLAEVSNVSSISETEWQRWRERLFPAYAELANAAPDLFPPISTIATVDVFLNLCVKYQCNSFGYYAVVAEDDVGVTRPNEERFIPSFAVATCPLAVLFNHSCDPNIARTVAAFGAGGSQGFYAARSIAEGEALTISYINHFDRKSLVERRTELSDSFKFHCNCDRCVDEEVGRHQEISRRRSEQCRHCGHGSTLLPIGSDAFDEDERSGLWIPLEAETGKLRCPKCFCIF